MAENDVRITGIDGAATQTLKNFGWATESTLAELVKLMQRSNTSAQSSQRILSQVAQTRKLSVDEVNRLADSIGKQVGESVKKSNKELRETREVGGSKMPPGFMEDEIKKSFGSTLTKGLSKATAGLSSTYAVTGSEFHTVVENIGSSLSSFGSKIGGVLGLFSNIFGSLVSVIGVAYERITGMNNMLKDLYAAGIQPSIGLEGLAKTAMATGMSMQNLTKMMTQFSGVAVTLGTRRLTSLQQNFANLTNKGADLLMSQEESQQAFLESMEMMRTSNELTTLTDEQIQTRGLEQVKMFNDLSQATGRNRDEIRKQTVELMKTTQMYGLTRAAGPAQSKQIQALMSNFTAKFGSSANEIANMVEGMFMGGPALMNDAMKPLLAIVPGFGQELEGITQGIKSGTLDPQAASDRIGAMFDRMDERTLQTLRAANPGLYNFVRQVQQNTDQVRAAAAEEAKMTAAEKTLRDNTLKQQQARQDAINKVNTGMNALRTSIDLALAKAIDPLIQSGAFSKIGTMLENLAEKIADWLVPTLEGIVQGLVDWVPKLIEGAKWFWETLKSVGAFIEKWTTNISPTLLVGAVITALAAPAVIAAIASIAAIAAVKGAVGRGVGAFNNWRERRNMPAGLGGESNRPAPPQGLTQGGSRLGRMGGKAGIILGLLAAGSEVASAATSLFGGRGPETMSGGAGDEDALSPDSMDVNTINVSTLNIDNLMNGTSIGETARTLQGRPPGETAQSTAAAMAATGAAGMSSLVGGGLGLASTVANIATTGALGATAAKTALKAVPGLGLAFGLWDAYSRIKEGDYLGAAISAGGGLAGLIPGAGTAVAAAAVAANLARDVTGITKPTQVGAAPPPTPATPGEYDFAAAAGGFDLPIIQPPTPIPTPEIAAPFIDAAKIQQEAAERMNAVADSTVQTEGVAPEPQDEAMEKLLEAMKQQVDETTRMREEQNDLTRRLISAIEASSPRVN